MSSGDIYHASPNQFYLTKQRQERKNSIKVMKLMLSGNRDIQIHFFKVLSDDQIL